MEHSAFIQTEYTRKHKAQPYDGNSNLIDWQNDYWYLKDNEKFVAPSSLHSEVIDFTKWMIAEMNKRLLSKESYNELLKVHSTPKKGKYYALGFETFEKPYHTLFFHGGNNDGFTGAYILDVKKKMGICIVYKF